MRTGALLFVLLCASLGSGQPTVPAGPAERVLTAWLSAFNSGDLAALEGFDRAHRPDAPPTSYTQRFRFETGGFALVRIEKSTATTITALLEERDQRRLSRLDLEVTSDARPIVVSSTLRHAVRTQDLPLAPLTEEQTIEAVTAKLDELLKADRFSGTVLIGHQGRIVFQKAVGLAHRESQEPATLDTKFRHGSVSKTFTAAAVMQLVETGQLSLDDTVGKVMVDYPNQDVERKVTIRHLLSHTGGTGEILVPGQPEFLQHRLTLKTHTDYVAMFGTRAPLFEPGTQYRYSNYGMVLLGAIIERVSGQSYGDYLRTKVFTPAGMLSTGSLPEADEVPHRATGYTRRNDAWVPNTDTLSWSGTAAGGGYSTAGDFFRFATALQSGTLVSNASLKQMITPVLIPGYGLGMHLGGEGAMRHFGNGGGAPGQNAVLRIFPESGYVLVALSNLDPPAASKMIDYIAARLPLATAPPATRSTTIVDDFESGTLAGWTRDRRGEGNWFTYQNGRHAPDPSQSNPFLPFQMPHPPQGTFAAVSDSKGPGSQFMYRDLTLEGPMMLELTLFYSNGIDGLSGYSSRFVSPRTLAINSGPNQQFRVDLLAATAAADSMAEADILATVFETRPDDPARRGPTLIRYDLSPWAGKTIRLRVAAALNQGLMRTGIDNVRLVPVIR